MLKIFKKIAISSLSIMAVGILIWALFLLNPKWSYAHSSEFENLTIFHNQDLEKDTEKVIRNAMHIIKKSDLYQENYSIQLCLNDGSNYPYLHPLAGAPMAYAFFDKTVVKNCKISFDKNTAETKWPINNYEFRTFDLTYLLAHEFTHNLQCNNSMYYFLTNSLKINWKLEGHAEYTARQFENDGKLVAKIDKFLIEEQNEFVGLPVFDLEDGTKQIFSYYKYALVIQYLKEEKKLSFNQICALEKDLESIYSEMIEWRKSIKI